MLISGGKPRFQHMSVIYITLQELLCSAVASKDGDCVLGINRAEELRAEYPSRPCGVCWSHEDLWVAMQAAGWLLLQSPFWDYSLSPLPQEYCLLHMGHEPAQDTLLPRYSAQLTVSKVEGLLGFESHRFLDECMGSLWKLFLGLILRLLIAIGSSQGQ